MRSPRCTTDKPKPYLDWANKAGRIETFDDLADARERALARVGAGKRRGRPPAGGDDRARQRARATN